MNMKTIKSFSWTLLLFGRMVMAAEIPVSVHAFEDKAAESNCRYGWDYWHRHLGSAFQEMLMNELKKSPEIRILERAQIDSVYNREHQLLNSENVAKPKKGGFKVAKYALVGALSEYEYCAEGKKAGLDVGALAGIGSLTIGGRTNSALIAVDIRVINVETGEVVKTVRGEGKIKDHKLDIDSDIGLGGRELKWDYETQKSSPIGKAARKAIEEAAQEIRSFLVKTT